MAILNFPNAAGQPTDGSFTYEDNGVLYSWDGYKWTANSEPGFDTRYVEVTGDTMTGDLTVPSLNGGPLGGLRNQIINGAAVIWQRGLSVSTQGYGADHWEMSSSVTRTFQKSNSASLIPEAPSPYLFGWDAPSSNTMTQPVELMRTGEMAPFMPDTTWTCSFYWTGTTLPGLAFSFNDGSGAFNSGDVIESDADAVSLGGNRYSHTFTIPAGQTIGASRTNFGVRFIKNSGDDDFITCVQLEPGPVATPFEHRPVGLELSLCQRYYCTNYDGSYSLNGNSLAINNLMVSAAATPNSTSATFEKALFWFPTQMRSTPTITTIAPDGQIGRFYAEGPTSITTLRGTDGTTTRASVFTAASGTILSGVINADAEL